MSGMTNVISVPQWGKATNTNNVIEKLISCNNFIRSKIVPPPLGSVIFNFQGGKVTLTGELTQITGDDDCEIIIRGDHVCLNGSISQAVSIFCNIHREIEEIKAQCSG
jgi:hypothetical protein